MFLDVLQEKNSELIKTAIELHQKGEILPDTYVLDVDAILKKWKRSLRKSTKEWNKTLCYDKTVWANSIFS